MLLLIESLLLATGGAVAGSLFAIAGVRALSGWIAFAPGWPTFLDVSPDAAVLGFLIAATMVSALASGMLPAIRLTRIDIETALKAGGRGTSTRSALRASGSLVAAQVALSIMLLTAAGLIHESLRNIQNTDLGVHGDVLLANFNSEGTYLSRREYLNLARDIQARGESLPGITNAAVASAAIYDGHVHLEFALPGGGIGSARPNAVSAGYFRTVGMRLLEGRDFSPQDVDGAPRVGIVNQAFVKKYLPLGGVVGRKIELTQPEYKGESLEIIAVVGDARQNAWQNPEPILYPCMAQFDSTPHWVFVRTSANPTAEAALLRRALRQVSPGLVILEMETLKGLLDPESSPHHLLARLIGFFGIAALALACIGIYAVVSYAVERRRIEIGIRMALGAGATRILWETLQSSLSPVAVGAALGALASIPAARFIERFTFGISALDATTRAAAFVILWVLRSPRPGFQRAELHR